MKDYLERDAIVAELQGGDWSRLERLFQLSRGSIGGAYARFGAGLDRVDYMQELRIALWQRLGGYRPGRFGGWFYRVCVCVLIDLQRTANRRYAHEVPDESAYWDHAGRAVYQPDLSEKDAYERLQSRVDAAFTRLSPIFRDAWVAKKQNELSYTECAEAIGIPEGTVKARVHRARYHLRECLAPSCEEAN